MQTLGTHVLITARNVRVAELFEGLYADLVQNHYVDCITGYDPNIQLFGYREDPPRNLEFTAVEL